MGVEHKYMISTHASLAGRDLIFPADIKIRVISTHASLAGRDDLMALTAEACSIFQPTRPLRDATFATTGNECF